MMNGVPFVSRYYGQNAYNTQPKSFGTPWRPSLNPMMGPSLLTLNPGEAVTLPLDAPIRKPPVNDDLQKKHPNVAARLAKNQFISDLSPHLNETAQTIGQVFREKPVKDSQLANLDDNMKRLGSLAIATMATVGLKQKVLGVGEYVGFMSWFGAMAATPTVINNMVRLKTGVNLGQKYDSSYGERLNLFKDPNYLPLHVISDETMNQVANRLHIPPGPNRRRETEEKMRQISVQTHTWWMLMAGPATPVISGLVADNLQAPVTRGYNFTKRTIANWRAKHAMSSQNEAMLKKRIDSYLNSLTGQLPESELTSWWKDFGEKITEHTGLRYALSRKDVMDTGENSLGEKISRYFTNEDEKAVNAKLTKDRLDEALKYLDNQYKAVTKTVDGVPKTVYEGKLPTLKNKAQEFLKSFQEHYEQELEAVKAAHQKTPTDQTRESIAALESRLAWLGKKSTMVDERMMNAANTISHYRSLLEKSLQTFESRFADKPFAELNRSSQHELSAIRSGIKQQLKNTTLNDLNQMKLEGRSAEAERIAGDSILWLENAIAGGKNKLANQIAGANPQQHLVRVLKEVKARSLWRNRVVYGMGGVMLAASAIYTGLFVGRDFKPAQPPAQPGGKIG